VVEKKISRKELLKEPDEFLTATGATIRYLRANPRQVIAVCLILIACSVAVLGYYAYSKHVARVSHELFRDALTEYETVFQNEKAASAEKVDELLSRFEQISQQYGSLPAGEMAILYSGHILFNKNDLNGALEKYRKVETTSLAGEGLLELFWYHIAKTRSALGDYDKAMALFEKLSKDSDSPYRRDAYANIARIYELTERRKEAVQAYRQYLKMFPEAPDAAFVRARIADLSAQG
jgi:predicted negative regulator of RcsB-dependent stress response